VGGGKGKSAGNKGKTRVKGPVLAVDQVPTRKQYHNSPEPTKPNGQWVVVGSAGETEKVVRLTRKVKDEG